MNAIRHVFLSLARNDSSHADKLRRLFCYRSDVRLVSSDDFGAGENWQTKLRESAAKSDSKSKALHHKERATEATGSPDGRKPTSCGQTRKNCDSFPQHN